MVNTGGRSISVCRVESRAFKIGVNQRAVEPGLPAGPAFDHSVFVVEIKIHSSNLT